MPKIYRRTENGTETLISVSDALGEVNDAMMGGSYKVETMSSSHGNHRIEYTDGRKVSLVEIEGTLPAPVETDSQGQRIVSVKGKRYIVGEIASGSSWNKVSRSWVPEKYMAYWSERNGRTFGSTRFAGESAKPGTVGRAIWDAVNEGN